MNTREVHFSPREREVLHLIGQHYTYDKIADDMKISKRTLHKYVENISHKIKLPYGVGKRVQHDIARYAIEHGYGKSEVAS